MKVNGRCEKVSIYKAFLAAMYTIALARRASTAATWAALKMGNGLFPFLSSKGWQDAGHRNGGIICFPSRSSSKEWRLLCMCSTYASYEDRISMSTRLYSGLLKQFCAMMSVGRVWLHQFAPNNSSVLPENDECLWLRHVGRGWILTHWSACRWRQYTLHLLLLHSQRICCHPYPLEWVQNGNTLRCALCYFCFE